MQKMNLIDELHRLEWFGITANDIETISVFDVNCIPGWRITTPDSMIIDIGKIYIFKKDQYNYANIILKLYKRGFNTNAISKILHISMKQIENIIGGIDNE